uniref:Beta-lactamase n=1 Tax=Streptomyces sp. NRRL 30471 TaxID=996287 RepID=F2WUE2_9ACTN|nr:beta-lactamase [Streptomyces sp. NRRL 30471]
MTAPSVRPDVPTGAARTDEQLRELLRAAAPKHDVPGAVLAVSHGGERFAGAYGVANSRAHLEMTTDTLIPVGSFAKVWTAVLVMQLVDEGVVDLDDPIRRHLPEFVLADAKAAERVTIRHLLTHTGGFYGDSFEDFGPGDDAPARYVAALERAAQLHEPGELFSYCNAGFIVLGHLVAKVRGGTWEEQIRSRVMRPLGLRDVALNGDEAVLFRNSVGHVVTSGRPRIVPRWESLRCGSAAGAMLRMSAESALTFCEAHVRQGRGANGKTLLSARSTAAMHHDWVDVPGSTLSDQWGIGWALWDWDGSVAFGHDGEFRGQAILIRNVAEHHLTVVLAVNGGRAREMYDDVVPALIEQLTGVRAPRTPGLPRDPTPVDARRYAGTYQGPDCQYTVTPAPDGRTLLVTTTDPRKPQGHEDGSPDHYVRLAGDTFIQKSHKRGTDRILSFVGDDHGVAVYLHNSRAYARA